MNPEEIKNILETHKKGEISVEDATARLKNLSYENIGFARVDHARAERQGFPEVIFGEGKTLEQTVGIFEKLVARAPNVLITRTSAEVFGEIRNVYTDAEWHEAVQDGIYDPDVPWKPEEPLSLAFNCTSMILQVRAVDTSGNVSPVITRSYKAPFPLSPAPNLTPKPRSPCGRANRRRSKASCT